MITPIPTRKSRRAKRMSIIIHPGGRWEVVVPYRLSHAEQKAAEFVSQYWGWIEQELLRAKRMKPQRSLSHRGIPAETIEWRTRMLVEALVLKIRQQHPFVVSEIRIRRYKAQWGNCSEDRRISFHYKLSLLPPELAEYIVVHELCHTWHFDHSKAFWALVESLFPDARACRKLLREFVP